MSNEGCVQAGIEDPMCRLTEMNMNSELRFNATQQKNRKLTKLQILTKEKQANRQNTV